MLLELWDIISYGNKQFITSVNLRTFLIGILNLKFDWIKVDLKNGKENKSKESDFSFSNKGSFSQTGEFKFSN